MVFEVTNGDDFRSSRLGCPSAKANELQTNSLVEQGGSM